MKFRNCDCFSKLRASSVASEKEHLTLRLESFYEWTDVCHSVNQIRHTAILTTTNAAQCGRL